MRDEPSRTAEAVCLFRAADQCRPPAARIVDDPYAKMFLGPAARTALTAVEWTGRLGELAEGFAPGVVTFVLCRHRFIDACLSRALNGAVAQIVLLGAGYDTRAYRLAEAIGERPVFEVDFPATSRRKAEQVEAYRDVLPAVEIRRVEIDFLSQQLDERLLLAGFQPNAATFFVWEGVAMYLTRKAVKDTLARIHQLGATGSTLAMDYWYLVDSPGLFGTAVRLSSNLLHLLGEPVTFSLHPEDAGPFMERLGFSVLDLADHVELRRRYVRDGRRIHAGNYVIEARSV